MGIIERKFATREVEICGLCKKAVDTHKDEWVAVIDFMGDKEMKTAVYHRFCLTDLIEGKGKIIQEAFKKKVTGAVKGLMGGLGNLARKQNTEVNNNGGYDERRIMEILG